MIFLRLLALVLALLLAPSGGLEASPFTPLGRVVDVEALRPGMKGYALTVVAGREVVKFPVEVVSVIPGKGTPSNLV